MKTPARLQSLQDEGFIDSVSRQLMSGKEASAASVSDRQPVALLRRAQPPAPA
jgi:hypothetical protein